MKYVADHVILAEDETPATLRKKISMKLGVSFASLRVTVIRKEWVRMAEGGHIEAKIEAETNEFIHNTAFFSMDESGEALQAPTLKNRPVIIGFGIKGIIAAFVLAKLGSQPLILEKKADVSKTEASDSAIDTGMLFTPDDFDPVLKRYLAEEGIVFDGIDAHQYLPPAFIRSLFHKLQSFITFAGGEILFGAEFLQAKKSLGKLRGVYYRYQGARKFQKCTQLLLSTDSVDDLFYLGFAVISSQRAYNEYIYGKTNVDAKTPSYFLCTKKATKNGEQYLSMVGLPKATLLDIGQNEQRLSQSFAFAGKGNNAVSYVACRVDKEDWDHLTREAYSAAKSSKIPYSLLSDFFYKKDPLKLGAIKPFDVLGAQLISMHLLFGSRVGEKLRSITDEMTRSFPFLEEGDALVGGMITLHGCSEVNAGKYTDKSIHVVAVLPEKSLDFAAVSAASMKAVHALCRATRKTR